MRDKSGFPKSGHIYGQSQMNFLMQELTSTWQEQNNYVLIVCHLMPVLFFQGSPLLSRGTLLQSWTVNLTMSLSLSRDSSWLWTPPGYPHQGELMIIWCFCLTIGRHDWTHTHTHTHTTMHHTYHTMLHHTGLNTMFIMLWFGCITVSISMCTLVPNQCAFLLMLINYWHYCDFNTCQYCSVLGWISKYGKVC